MDFRREKLELLNDEIIKLENEYERKLNYYNWLSKSLKIISGLCGTTNTICGVIVTALLNANVTKQTLLPLTIIVSIMSIITTSISSQDVKSPLIKLEPFFKDKPLPFIKLDGATGFKVIEPFELGSIEHTQPPFLK